MQLLLEQHLTIPAHTLDLEYPKGVAGSAVPFHLHMFRQFWAGPAKNDLLIGAGCPATPSIRDFYERNVVEGAGAGAGGPTPFPCQKHHCACATKASFNAHLACRLAGFCFKYIFSTSSRAISVGFVLYSYFISLFFHFYSCHHPSGCSYWSSSQRFRPGPPAVSHLSQTKRRHPRLLAPSSVANLSVLGACLYVN